MRTLAIGDIHGCRRALTTLLDSVKPKKDDQLIFLGDYIDRGPDSPGVINTLLGLQNRCKTVFLRGNHECMMLDARDSFLKSEIWQNCGGLETVTSYGAEGCTDWASCVPDAHWSFLEQTVRAFETEKQIFVHACLDPNLELKEQPDWVLFWEYFERMQPHKSGKKVICGHTPQTKGLPGDVGHAICIDTGCVYGGGWLTCLDVDSGHCWQANEKGEFRQKDLDSPLKRSSSA
jgi:serine/threonine protein phosphatase 1